MDQRDLEKAVAAAARMGNAMPTAAAVETNEIDSLKREIQAAKRERSRLLLEKASAQNNKFRITTVGSKVATRSDPPIQSNVQQQTTANALLQRTKSRRTAEALNSFRLAGISCFSVGGRPLDIGFRFDSTFGGQMLDEKYYVILTAEDNVSLSVYRHSLPHFIPVANLATLFLPNDPAQFARRISRYVCAFAQRKILAERMENDFAGSAHLVDCSLSYDIITLRGRLEAQNRVPVHSVQLKFANVLEVLPNQAVVTFLKADGRAMVSEVILDPVQEPNIVVMDNYFDYSLWVRSVLDRRYGGATAVQEDEDE